METYTANNKILTIEQDDCDESPRNWDNLSTMVFVGGKKHLGDKHDWQPNQYDDRFDFIEKGEQEVRKHFKDVVVCLPVHYYEHSGACISTNMSYPFNCRWDSGTIGFCIVTKTQIRKEYGVKQVTQKLIDKAKEIAECEVETLSQWLSGDVYSFSLTDEDGNHIDSCGGFYGSDVKTNGMLDHLPKEFEELVK